MTPIELPLRYSAFRFDAETGATILVVTADGNLHAIDAKTGAITNTLKEVVAPFSFRRNVPRPGLVTAHHFA
jgi:hypothetical protein